MEGTVWKVLADERLPLSHHIEPVTSHFLSYPCQLIVNDDVDVKKAKELLFSAGGCLGVSNWEGLQHSFAPNGEGDGYFKYPTPHRCVRYFSEEGQYIGLVSSLLVDKCQWMPLQLAQWELWKGTVRRPRPYWGSSSEEYSNSSCSTTV